MKMGWVWKRAKLRAKDDDPARIDRLARIRFQAEHLQAQEMMVFADELDIHLLPKVGAAWMPKGRQEEVLTPGKNEKHYLAGALRLETGQVLHCLGPRKNNGLFVAIPPQNCANLQGLPAPGVCSFVVTHDRHSHPLRKPPMDIVALCQCFQPYVTATTLRHFHRITAAMVVRTGRVTMLGLSRWAGTGGRYRPVQRFFSTVLPWATLFWGFFRHQVSRPEDTSLLVGDEVVATKAGKHTHGLDRFFASLYGKPVPGLAFFTLSLVSGQARRSFPIRVEQVVRSEAEQAASKAQAAAKKSKAPCAKRRPGRPKGSTSAPKADVTFTPAFVRITSWLDALLQRIAGVVSLPSLVLEGPCGNHNALQRARQSHLHLIAKLRYDAALYFPSTGSYAGRGPRRK